MKLSRNRAIVNWLVLIVIIGISSLSCSDKEEEQVIQNPTVATPTPTSYNAYIYYRNSQGKDLLENVSSSSRNYISVTWPYGSGTLVWDYTVYLNTNQQLPNGYCFNVASNVSTHGLMKFIYYSSTKTDTLSFAYSGTTLKQVFYNKTMISPPAGATDFPADFPIVIVK